MTCPIRLGLIRKIITATRIYETNLIICALSHGGSKLVATPQPQIWRLFLKIVPFALWTPYLFQLFSLAIDTPLITPLTMSQVLSLADVQLHNSKDDLHFIIGGKVYDATEFLEEHP